VLCPPSDSDRCLKVLYRVATDIDTVITFRFVRKTIPKILSTYYLCTHNSTDGTTVDESLIPSLHYCKEWACCLDTQ